MKKNTAIPAIRFKGFTAPWEQRKLGEIGQTYTGLSGKTKDDFGHGQARFVTYMNVFSNPISSPEMTEPIEIDPKQNEVEVGDVFFTTSSETPEEVGMSSVLLEKQGTTYLNSFCFGFRPSEKIDHHYLAYMLRSEAVREKIILLAQGISRYNISKNKVMEIAVSFPLPDEQRQIGQYFQQLDTLITLHQRKSEQLLTIKKSMLEKMFPQKGSCYPEIRFKGFTAPWEQRKLGEIGQTYTGLSGKTKDDFGHGQARFVTYMNVFSNPISSPEMTEPIEIDPKQNEVEVGDVFFTTSSETPEEVGMSSVLLEKQGTTYLNSFCFGFRPSEKIDHHYLAYMLRSEAVREKIILLAQGISRYNISKNKVMEIAVSFPLPDEQRQIGQYFQQLDTLITLHQRKSFLMKQRRDFDANRDQTNRFVL